MLFDRSRVVFYDIDLYVLSASGTQLRRCVRVLKSMVSIRNLLKPSSKSADILAHLGSYGTSPHLCIDTWITHADDLKLHLTPAWLLDFSLPIHVCFGFDFRGGISFHALSQSSVTIYIK